MARQLARALYAKQGLTVDVGKGIIFPVATVNAADDEEVAKSNGLLHWEQRSTQIDAAIDVYVAVEPPGTCPSRSRCSISRTGDKPLKLGER